MPEKPKTSGYSIAAAKKYLKDKANWSDKRIAAFVRRYPKDYASKLINAVAAHRRAMTAKNSNKTAITKELDAQRAANPTDGSIPKRPKTGPREGNKSTPPTINKSTTNVRKSRQAPDPDEVRKTGQGNRQSAEGAKAAAYKKRHSGENKGAGGAGGMGKNNSPTPPPKKATTKDTTSAKPDVRPAPVPRKRPATGTTAKELYNKGKDEDKKAVVKKKINKAKKKSKAVQDYNYPGDAN